MTLCEGIKIGNLLTAISLADVCGYGGNLVQGGGRI